MTYNYSGNRLSSIVKGGTTYTYAHDSNGNVTTDGIRGMTIIYNYLNLPKSVVKGADNLEFIYDATGVRLATKQNGTTQNYYTGAVVYKSDKTPDYILTSSGMIRKNGANYIRQYNITDHLGNVRSVVNQSGTVEQATDYYPYGLSFSNNNLTKNRYLYNGKEIQNQTLSSQFFGMYDYGARYYDPVIGRWMGVDPLAADYYSLSPYGYCAGNPIVYSDENGEWINFVVGSVIGAATDYALQVATNYVKGKKGLEAWTDVSGSSIAVSAVAGATGVGIATKVGKAMKVAKMAKGMKATITVGTEVATDAVVSATNQLVTTGEVDLKDVAIDATAGQIVGKTVSKAVQNKAQASRTAKVLHNQADRAQRVAKGSREVRQVAADKATKKAENFGAGRATAAGVASSGTASTVVRELDDKTINNNEKVFINREYN